AGTYTINPALPASSTNFQSIATAISAISCGIAGNIIFNLAPGTTFNEQVTLPATIGTTASQTVTFNGNGDTVKFAGTSTQPWTIGLDGADYITFNDLIVVNTSTTNAISGHLWNDADHNTFNNCTFLVDITATSSLVVPFSISGSATSATTAGNSGQYNVLDSCTIVGGYYNTVLYGNTVGNSSGNKVMNSTMSDFYFYGAFIYYQDSLELTNNIIERPTRATISTFYGIYLSTGCTNALVQQNRVRNMSGGSPTSTSAIYGIYGLATSTAGNENKFYNNLISNFSGNGASYAMYLTGQYIQAYHNTIAVDNTAATTSIVRGIWATGTAGIDIKNNNVSITQGGTGAKHCLYFSGAGKTSNYNNLYMGSTTGTNNIGYYSADFSTLTAWQGANSNAWDQNSLSVDPMPLSPATGNFSPTNSMLDNFGTPIASVPTDINGAVRSAVTPDMGAYEFSIPPCLGTPSTAGIANANLDSACVGGPVQLSLTGYPLQSGITIQWQESYGANIWNDIIGATTANYTASFAATAKYRAYVSCNFGTPVYSNEDSVSQMSMWACYCSPYTGQALHTNNANYITNVAITGTSLNNPSTTVGAGGYTRYYPSTATTTDSLMQNVSYPLSVTLTSTSYTGIAWVDFDRNGTFDFGESIVLTNGQGTIAVPLFATPGPTGMRIRVATNATTYTSIDACLNSTTGYETEDYVVTIVPNIACSGTPSTGGTASVDKDTLCVMGDVKLSLANYPLNMGIAINWQSSPAGANTFTDILGAITDTFTVLGLSTSTDFRMRVTCTNTGGGTTYSNTETVIVNNPQLAMTIPGSRCGTGEVALYAAAANGGGVNWYDSLTGGTKVGTGNIFITPSISTTTPYFAAATLGGGAIGTIPMPTWSSNYSGNVRGFWFTAPTSFTITSLKSLATTTGVQSIAVIKFNGNTPPPTYSTTTNAFTTLYLTQNNSATGPIPVNIPIASGDVIGVMAQIGGAAAYTTTAGPYTSAIAGFPVVLTRMGMQYSLNTTAPLDIWQEPGGTIGAVAMTYSIGCEGARTQVSATINPAGTGNVSPGGTVVVNSQSSATTQSYGTCNDTVAVVNSGTTNLGITSAVTVTPLTVQTFGAQPYVPRAFDINPTTNGPATVTLYVLQSEFTAYNSYLTSTSSSLPMLPTGPSDATGMSHIVVTQYHGASSAGTQGPLGLYSNSNIEFIPNSSITVTPVGSTYWKLTFPVSGFSGFFIHSGATPLDIKLASIAAANFGNRNRIDWTTADESNASYFELESSVDAKAFITLGRTNAKGKASSYSYWDEQPAKGMNYYRLKVHMNNGSYTYSDVVRAFVAGGSAIMVEAYPNPTNDVLQVKVNGVQGDDAHILITDIAGKVLRRIPMESATTTISMSGMANGLYLLKYIDNTHQQTLRVTKQ
ncbi:MAG TPA: GEVED domain-containing protein, partial [Flavipsychrobacter sp.]|nr:GEVED domain-containing protein [Flavipsychrobacter sp.]